MRILIVEDETAAAESLAHMLRRMEPSVEIAGYSESVEQTVEILLSDRTIDLIFMDIHLSDGSAFEIFDKTDVGQPIVFTTAYDQHALEAFKVNSIDYLLKPVKRGELRRALDRYNQRTPSGLLEYLSAMTRLRPASHHYQARLLVPVKDRIIPVEVDTICYIYSTNRSTKLVLTDGSHIEIKKSLDQILTSLNPEAFIRANKQYIVAKRFVTELVAWYDSRLLVRMTVDTPEEIFISKNNAADFKKWLSQ